MRHGWPATLTWGRLRLRPIRQRDRADWHQVRQRNAAWLARWDATAPPGGTDQPMTFATMVRAMRREALAGRQLSFVMEYDGRLIGQVSVNNVVRGSAQFATIGYWIDEGFAGQGLTTRAVAMVIDHCFTAVRLHRVEIAIRPENAASLRVVEKLGIPEIGYAPRYLHIDGDWRDHRLFAICREECPDGIQARIDAPRTE